jgi:hypothetical protein
MACSIPTGVRRAGGWFGAEKLPSLQPRVPSLQQPLRRRFETLGLVTMFGLGMVTASGHVVSGQAGQSAVTTATGTTKNRLVGTWKLLSVEQRNAGGQLIPPVSPASLRPPLGILIYDAAGYVAVTIMPGERRKYAAAQPTDEEAQAALTGYAAYVGTFTINDAEGVITHHLQGSVNPGMAPEQKRRFELSGNRLTLKPPPGPGGTQSQLTWERLPDLTNLTAGQQQFPGFWKFVSNERRNEKGDLLSSNVEQTGYIIFTAAGQMMVHLVQPGRKKYAADRPTPEEARETIRTYANYVGPFYVHEADRYVVYDQVGTLNLGLNGPGPLQRFYEFSGKRLQLTLPLAIINGQTIQDRFTWERASEVTGSQ